MRATLLAVLVLAFVPAGASAACPARPTTDLAAQASVVFVGWALDGPSDPRSGTLYDPARFGVLAYEKGSGPMERLVHSGLQPGVDVSEGLHPRAGDLWRIDGVGNADVLDTNSCTGSHPVLGSLDPPVVRVAGRTLTPAPSTLVGDPFPVHAPRLRTRAAVVRLFAGRPLATVHLVRRGQILVEGSTDTSRRTWTLSVPPGISRLVLDTGDRVYAASLSRTSRR